MKEHLERNNFRIIYRSAESPRRLTLFCGSKRTVAVEAMMLDCYMVALYRVSPLSAFVVRHLVRTKYYTIPNILLGDELFPN